MFTVFQLIYFKIWMLIFVIGLNDQNNFFLSTAKCNNYEGLKFWLNLRRKSSITAIVTVTLGIESHEYNFLFVFQ